MLPGFDRLRAAQIDRCETRAFPRIVPSLRAIDDLYLCSLPGHDSFLRRDGSVWDATAEGSPSSPTIRWTQATESQRIVALVIGAWRLPEVGVLLPPRSADAVDCPECIRRDLVLGFIVCHRCLGLGWIAAPAT